jgi:hypothetical protein
LEAPSPCPSKHRYGGLRCDGQIRMTIAGSRPRR